MPSLMSHVSIAENVGLYTNDTAIARDRGLDNVFGETNSGKLTVKIFLGSLYVN